MAIVDVYDALTSPRVYKPAMTHEEATALIGEGAGTQFDPNIVSVFLADSLVFAEVVKNHQDGNFDVL
jgi:putative two-component system response regulator